MKKKAILFDKDGTLLAFDAFWLAVTEYAVDDILARLGMEHVSREVVLEAFGVVDGVVDITGVLCHGTYKQMGEALHASLAPLGCTADSDAVTTAVTEAYRANKHHGRVEGDCENIAAQEELEKCRVSACSSDL